MAYQAQTVWKNVPSFGFKAIFTRLARPNTDVLISLERNRFRILAARLDDVDAKSA